MRIWEVIIGMLYVIVLVSVSTGAIVSSLPAEEETLVTALRKSENKECLFNKFRDYNTRGKIIENNDVRRFEWQCIQEKQKAHSLEQQTLKNY